MSVINLINTGTSANSGNGDTLRTAFSKVNDNLLNLERSFVEAGVTSFNGSIGTVQFTATDITNILGFTPYPDSNPLSFVTTSTIALQNYAELSYVDTNFVTNTILTSRNYITKSYVDGALSEHPTFLYLNNQGFLTPITLPNYLTLYATTDNLADAAISSTSYTDAAIKREVNDKSILPSVFGAYNLGAEESNWGFLYLSSGLYIKEIGITFDTNGRLNIANNDFLGNFHIGQGNIVKWDKQSFAISPEWNGDTPGDKLWGKSYIFLPNDADANGITAPLEIINTGTSGIVLATNTSSIKINSFGNFSGISITSDLIKLDGNINIPLILKSPFNTLAGFYPILGNHTLSISPNNMEFRNEETHTAYDTPFVSPEIIITHPITLKSITNTGTHAPILLKGSSVGFYASYTTDENLIKYFNPNSGTQETPGYMVLDNSGLWIGTNRVHGGVPAAITLDELNQVGSPFEYLPDSPFNTIFSGYKLPLTQGNPGQTLVQSTGTSVLWTDANPTNELGTLTANNTATISMITGGWNHVTADGSIDVELTNITTGSSVILIVTNISGGTIYVTHGVPNTQSFNGSPIFSIGNNTTRNVIYRSFGTSASDVYVSLT